MARRGKARQFSVALVAIITFATAYQTSARSNSETTPSSASPAEVAAPEGGVINKAAEVGMPGASWLAAIAASPDPGVMAFGASLVLDSTGNPVVAYPTFDSALSPPLRRLKVLHCGNPACTAGNTVVIADERRASGFTGPASLKLDRNGHPVVSYTDIDDLVGLPALGRLKVLHCGDVTCTAGNTIAVPEESSRSGFPGTTSLSLDPIDNPVVSYFGGSGGGLRLLRCGDASCTVGNTITVVETASDAGANSSLVLDAAGNPVIGNELLNGGIVQVVHCGDPRCTAGNTFAFPEGFTCCIHSSGPDSLKLDASGNPVTTYGAPPRVLHCGDPACLSGNSIVIPDPAGNGVWSLALNTSGNPVVTYGVSAELKLLKCGNANCTSGNEVASLAQRGNNASLSLDAAGNPVVAYVGANQELRVLHCANANCSLANQLPVAHLTMTAGSQSATENQTLSLSVIAGANANVSFSAANSFDPDGSIASYEWRISGTLVSTSTAFAFTLGAGHHDVLLTVQDNGGLSASVGGAVDVNLKPVALFKMSSGSRVATERQTLQVFVPPGGAADVAFSAADSFDPEGGPLTYQWTVGATTNTSRDFILTLNEGQTQVLLAVTDNKGAESSAPATLLISRFGSQPPPKPTPTVRPKIFLVPGMSRVNLEFGPIQGFGDESREVCATPRDYRTVARLLFNDVGAFFGHPLLPGADAQQDAEFMQRFAFEREDFQFFNYNSQFDPALPMLATTYLCTDTHQPLEDLRMAFEKQFNGLMTDSSFPRIDIIAHSLGGVIVGYWAGATPGPTATQLQAIHSFVAFSSPLRGLSTSACDVEGGGSGTMGQVGKDLCNPLKKAQVLEGLRRLHAFTVNNTFDWATNGKAGNGQTVAQGLAWYSEDRKWPDAECSVMKPVILPILEVLPPIEHPAIAHVNALCMHAIGVRALVKKAIMNDFFDARPVSDPLGQGGQPAPPPGAVGNAQAPSHAVVCSELWELRGSGLRGNLESIQGTLMQTVTARAECHLDFEDKPNAAATTVIWHTWRMLDLFRGGLAHVLVDGEERCENGCPVVLFGALPDDQGVFPNPQRAPLQYTIRSNRPHRVTVFRDLSLGGTVTTDGFEVVRCLDPGCAER